MTSTSSISHRNSAVVFSVPRSEYTTLDQLDVPLINTDGSLHIVELKKANIPTLFRIHRNHLIVGDDVHEAVAQTENYLHGLNAEAYAIEGKLKIDVHQASEP